MEKIQRETLDSLFHPENVAVVGASANPGKLGHMCISSVTSGGFQGKIFTVNPSSAGGHIMGAPCYAAIDDLPEAVQLFIFAIPHNRIEDALIAAARKGAKGAVVFAGGFKETGAEGEDLQNRIRYVADTHGIKIIGPNCAGTLNPHHGLNATFIFPGFKFKKGGVAVVSQSGGTSGAILNSMIDSNVGLSKLVSIGNRVNLDFAEMIDYLGDDPATRVICLFIEGIDAARNFFETAKKVSRKKPILAYQAGFAASSKVLALSHTGSMSESEDVYRSALAQAGVLLLNDIEEMVDTAKGLSMCEPIEGSGAAILTHSAGPAIIISDTVESGGGRVADFSTENKRLLLEFIPRFSNPINPLDMFAHAHLDTTLYLKSLDVALSQPDIHIACACYIPNMGEEYRFPAREYADIAHKHHKPAILAYQAGFAASSKVLALS
ncbi:CoA-binding protein, partial [Thermodesulfobacteriota bacterium]